MGKKREFKRYMLFRLPIETFDVGKKGGVTVTRHGKTASLQNVVYHLMKWDHDGVDVRLHAA
jgi:hypothetical protein